MNPNTRKVRLHIIKSMLLRAHAAKDTLSISKLCAELGVAWGASNRCILSYFEQLCSAGFAKKDDKLDLIWYEPVLAENQEIPDD